MKNQMNKVGRRRTRFPKQLRWLGLPAFFVCCGFLAPLYAESSNRSLNAEAFEISEVHSNVLQQSTLEGTVNDTDGSPLPGASVVVKGTTRGVTTDFDGNFSIQAEVGETLEISYIGMKKQEVTVANMEPLSIAMETDSSELDEVVVV